MWSRLPLRPSYWCSTGSIGIGEPVRVSTPGRQDEAADDVARIEDVSGHLDAVVLAFAADPFVRWLLPDPAVFLRTFSKIARLHGERTAANDGAFGRRDCRGAAFWYLPGVHPDGGALGPVLEEAGVSHRVAAVFDAAAVHEPTGPYFYLRQIGLDPPLQGQGHGRALLVAGLAEVDRQHSTAYLEATSNASRMLYERHGFATLGEITVGGSPPLWPMVRAAA
jgi:GNAT superfamily N-acetyltransferase